jgi:thymidine kinase
MKSGKTEKFIEIFSDLEYTNAVAGIVFNPAVNTRDPIIKSRVSNRALKTTIIDEQHPDLVFNYLDGPKGIIVGFDETQFFDMSIIGVIDDLLREDYHVVASGLMLDFKGEPFGPMPTLVGRSHEITKLSAICEYPGCSRRATQTQRLINGEPAPYNSPIVLIEGGGHNEEYQARCIQHHYVPR